MERPEQQSQAVPPVPESYRAAREGAAVFFQEGLGLLKLTGPDRTTWLQGMVSNDVEKLLPGEGCFAAHLNAQGKLVAQLVVLAAEDALWLQTERVVSGKLAEVFDRLIVMEDVQVLDVSADHAVLGILGAKALSLLDAWMGASLGLDAPYSHRQTAKGRVVRSALGCELIVPRGEAPRILAELLQAGAQQIDEEVWNVVRTEAGLPVYGKDVDETTTLPELGERGISYDKGCYIGQEVVARVKYIGHVNRRFVGLICEGLQVPGERTTVRHQGKDVGYTTTAVYSPAMGKPIALGFVSRAASTPGTEVELTQGDASLAARVAALPFKRFGD